MSRHDTAISTIAGILVIATGGLVWLFLYGLYRAAQGLLWLLVITL